MNAIRHFEKESGDALLRGLDQQHDVVLRAREFARRKAKKLCATEYVARGERRDGAAFDHQDLGVADRLGGERVLRAGLEAEDVARQ